MLPDAVKKMAMQATNVLVVTISKRQQGWFKLVYCNDRNVLKTIPVALWYGYLSIMRREDKCFIAKNLDNFPQYAEYQPGGFDHDEACMRTDKS